MPNYRIYLVGNNGHFKDVILLDCADDETAITEATFRVDGQNAELWLGGRLLAQLPHPLKKVRPLVAFGR